MNGPRTFLPSLLSTMFALAVPGPAIAQSDPAPLDWLAGCWEVRREGLVIQEHWMPPLGGLMLGVGRTVIRDTVRSYEYVRIESLDTEPIYVADPYSQRRSVDFPMARISCEP